MVADPLIATVHNCSTVFVRWRQSARPSDTRFLWPPLTMANLSSIEAAVSTINICVFVTDCQDGHGTWPVKTGPLTLFRSGVI